jgi:alpha-glucoside transport system permease protein
MTVTEQELGTGGEPPEPPPNPPTQTRDRTGATWLLAGVVGLVVVVVAMSLGFQALYLYPPPKLLQVPLGLLGGVGGAMLFFYFLNMLVEALPGRLSRALLPYAFLLPAFGLIGLMLIYPTVQTVVYSFADRFSESWVGFENYTTLFSDSSFRDTLVNNLLWLAIVPAFTVAIGLGVAQLSDRLSPRWEKITKSIIFLPMAISFVGAATIWRFIYTNSGEGRPQVGLLNAILTKLGVDPITFLSESQFNLNDMLLMVILIWLQTGFAMVLLSAAIKSVPEDTLEAARLDGASEWKIFWQVVVPQIRGTIITVFVTVLILVLKVFDIVYVMTNGRDDTNVLGLKFFQEIFIARDNGTAAAVVVVLLLAVLPVLVYQVRNFRAEERAR